MRTGARVRSLSEALWRCRGLRGLLSLILLAGAGTLESAGQRIGGVFGGLVTPAEARKDRPRLLPGVRRTFDHRRRARAFQIPPSSSFQRPSAFLPPLRSRHQPPGPHVPAFKPSPPLEAFRLPESGGPSAVRLHRVGRTSRVDRIARRSDGSPGTLPRVHSDAGGWDVLVRHTPGSSPSVSGRPVFRHAAAVPAATAKAPWRLRRLLDKLASRRGRPARVAAAREKLRQTADKRAIRRAWRRGGGRRRVGELLPPAGSFKPHEVLAVNLSAAGLAKARARSYQVARQTRLPGLGLTLTHLVPPATMNAVSAREQLLGLVPDAGFALNRVYSPYRLGAGPRSARRTTSAQGGRCPSERCFGGALIQWRARLAACARDVKIGIIDTGFDKGHPALSGVRYEYEEFVPAGSARASAQHGTGVLSLLAGRADSGTPGLVPDASFAIANAFFDDANGQPISDTAQMVRALDWLGERGVAVVNLSFAGPQDDLVHRAVRELTKSGAVVVAAAGNEGPGAPPSYPAAYQEVIAVTAVDRNLAAYRYASRGAHIDIAAPGVDVWTALPGRREGPQTGTSFAVPYVTAVVAVALSTGPLQSDRDALSSKQRALARLRGNIRNLGHHGRDPIFGEGLVQAPASCDPPALTVAARQAGPQDGAWAGTVRRALDSVAADTLGVGPWISTVTAVSGDGPGL